MIIEIPGEDRVWSNSLLRKLHTKITTLLAREYARALFYGGETVDRQKSRFFEIMSRMNTFNHIDDNKSHHLLYKAVTFHETNNYMMESDYNWLFIGITDRNGFEGIKGHAKLQGYREMPVLQKELQENEDHKIFVTKKQNSTYVLTTYQPSWKNLYKILKMHYEWNKDTYSTANKDYEKLINGYLESDLIAVQEAYDTLIFKNDELIKREFVLCAKNFEYDKEANLTRVQQQIDEQRKRMQETVDYYNTLNRDMLSLQEDYETIRCKESNVDVEKIADFLMNNQYLTPSREGNAVRLNYIAPILDYDEAVAEHQLMYRDQEEKEILNIFIHYKEKYRLWTHASILIDSRNTQISATCNELVREHEDHQLYGHPHINEYGCLGNHPGEIIPFMNQGNYIGAINQITAMVFNLNFADGPVTNTLISNLNHRRDIRAWEDTETGKFLTTAEVIENIKEKENGTTETE